MKSDSVPFGTETQQKEKEYSDELNEHSENDETEVALMMMEKYNDCKCCNGDVYNCQDPTCMNLGACFCMIQD